MPKYNREIVVNKFMKVHGDKYDYSKFIYNGIFEKGIIICPKHGEFLQAAHDHMRGHGCPKCYIESKLNIPNEELNCKFIKKAQEIHHNEYDYSCIVYHNNNTKVLIRHMKCGKEFWQSPKKHLRGQGCPYCSKTRKSTTYDFIKKAKKIHGDKYDYSKVNYINNKTKVCIIHKDCGEEFCQTPHNHLKGRGCPYCRNLKSALSRTKSTNDFIDEARKIHDNKYDYSHVEYINSKQKVHIICPTHGDFLQTPSSHLMGCGCPKCNQSKMEEKTENMLIKHKINFISQKRFDWLGLQSLDFYLPDYNIVIECQGKQHFEPVTFGSCKDKDKMFKNIKLLDENKHELCKEHNINLIYYT